MGLMQKKKVKSIEVINNSDQIATQVSVEWHTYDTIDPEMYGMRHEQTFTLETDDVDPTSDTFVAFEELTEKVVLGWLEERFQSPRIVEMENRMKTEISNRVNPPEPVEPKVVRKDPPWI
jgi:hypothetical protein